MFQLHTFLNHLLDIETGDVDVMCKYASSTDTCPCNVFPSHEEIYPRSLKNISFVLRLYTYMSQAIANVPSKTRSHKPGHIGCNIKRLVQLVNVINIEVVKMLNE